MWFYMAGGDEWLPTPDTVLCFLQGSGASQELGLVTCRHVTVVTCASFPELHSVHPSVHIRPADLDGQPVHLCLRLLQCWPHREVLQAVCTAEGARAGGEVLKGQRSECMYAHTCACMHVLEPVWKRFCSEIGKLGLCVIKFSMC